MSDPQPSLIPYKTYCPELLPSLFSTSPLIAARRFTRVSRLPLQLAYQDCAVHTDVFDGPLELLLFLVRREGVDITEVSIAPITDAFLAHLDLVEALDLDTAGDFLVMAATLCQLKSRELLPRDDSEDAFEDDEDDPREALARRLLEYERYREASLELAARPMLGRDVFCPVPIPLEAEDRPIEPGVDTMGLLEVFYRVLQRNTEAPPVHEIELEPYSLQQVGQWLIDRLDDGPRELSELMRDLGTSRDRVLAFLASLEMARLQVLDITQRAHLGPVVLRSLLETQQADLSFLSEGA